MSEKAKVVHAELKGNLAARFDIIKSTLGIQNDAEVVRYLIQHYFNENMQQAAVGGREEVLKDRAIIAKFMERYGDEWRKLGEDE